MKIFLMTVLTTIALILNAYAADSVLTDSGVDRVRLDVAAQIERARRVIEMAEFQADLARHRVAAQLEAAEERLTLQMEQLKRYKEYLGQYLERAGFASDQFNGDLKRILTAAQEEIARQIGDMARLIDKLRKLRTSRVGESRTEFPWRIHSERCPEGLPDIWNVGAGTEDFTLENAFPPSIDELEKNLEALRIQGSDPAPSVTPSLG